MNKRDTKKSKPKLNRKEFFFFKNFKEHHKSIFTLLSTKVSVCVCVCTLFSNDTALVLTCGCMDTG